MRVRKLPRSAERPQLWHGHRHTSLITPLHYPPVQPRLPCCILLLARVLALAVRYKRTEPVRLCAVKDAHPSRVFERRPRAANVKSQRLQQTRFVVVHRDIVRATKVRPRVCMMMMMMQLVRSRSSGNVGNDRSPSAAAIRLTFIHDKVCDDDSHCCCCCCCR